MNAVPRPLEVRMVRLRLGHASYPRPCIIVDMKPGGPAVVIHLSTKDYGQPGQSFRLDETDADFPATGLAATSYTAGPARTVPLADIGGCKGCLQRALVQAFEAWLAG